MSDETSIRLATPQDAPAMARLLHPGDVPELTARTLGNHYLLVAEEPTEHIVAVAMIEIEEQRAHLRMLAVSPARDDEEELAERRSVAAAALGAACGCEVIEVPANSMRLLRDTDDELRVN